MKFLADHCVYGKTVKLLRAQGHEVITLKELGQADAEEKQHNRETLRRALAVIDARTYRIRKSGGESAH